MKKNEGLSLNAPARICGDRHVPIVPLGAWAHHQAQRETP